jgi:hypothetical protein
MAVSGGVDPELPVDLNVIAAVRSVGRPPLVI